MPCKVQAYHRLSSCSVDEEKNTKPFFFASRNTLLCPFSGYALWGSSQVQAAKNFKKCDGEFTSSAAYLVLNVQNTDPTL